MKVKFEGGRQLEAAFRELDITQARKKGIARRALDRAAEPIHDDWAAHVDKQSGDMKKSIKIGSRKATKANRKFARGAGKDIVERFVGIDLTVNDRLAVYAPIEELGSEKQPANPAGRAAFESKKNVALDRLGDDLWEEIEKVAKRVNRKVGA
ncbi:hypothetical protein WJT74_05160 [Sphingomicrobium sp. XHP0239]|uniref:hypothetical protein n=1 Tax=Sphingomicrobium maritimum TaxID=3133972 RepID=UPI0031CC52C2